MVPIYNAFVDATLVNTIRMGESYARPTRTAVPHLFLVMESHRPTATPVRVSLKELDEVIIGRGRARELEHKIESGVRRLYIRVPDPWMSSLHARIERHLGYFLFSDAESTNGSSINGSSVYSAALQEGDLIELGQTFFLYRAAIPVSENDPAILSAADIQAPEGLVSMLPGLSQRFGELGQVAKTTTSVVLLGQSGTGKEVIAKASHELSERPGPFIAVNCGALPEALVESELFGHKKGSFSGATDDRRGLVLAAHGGTLFLDEIGDMPLFSQAALLRVLQEREVMPVGGTQPIPVDFRLVCATHRNMEAQVKEGKFREDLLARLAGFVIELPPLRARLEDMGLLIGALIRRICDELDHNPEEVSLANDVVRTLMAYPWPRNIRQLRTCLQTALALAGMRRIELVHLGDSMNNAIQSDADVAFDDELEDDGLAETVPSRNRPRAATLQAPLIPRKTGTRDDAIRDQLVRLLREHQGNVSAVARDMGKARAQIHRWLRRFEIDPESFRP